MNTVDTTKLEWIPLREGLSFKPLYFFPDDSAVEYLLRVEPGTVIERHRHTGEIHAFNLSGKRLLIETNQIVGPGTYVYEPTGNVDSWKVVGDEPCVIHIEFNGRIEYLGDDGTVLKEVDAGIYRRKYLEWRAGRRSEKPSAEPVGAGAVVG